MQNRLNNIFERIKKVFDVEQHQPRPRSEYDEEENRYIFHLDSTNRFQFYFDSKGHKDVNQIKFIRNDEIIDDNFQLADHIYFARLIKLIPDSGYSYMAAENIYSYSKKRVTNFAEYEKNVDLEVNDLLIRSIFIYAILNPNFPENLKKKAYEGYKSYTELEGQSSSVLVYYLIDHYLYWFNSGKTGDIKVHEDDSTYHTVNVEGVMDFIHESLNELRIKAKNLNKKYNTLLMDFLLELNTNRNI